MSGFVEAAAKGLRRNIGMMEARESRAMSRRDLVLAAMTVVGLSRFAEGVAIWVVAVLLLVAMLLGTLQVLADADPLGESRGVPIEALLTPSVAALAWLGALRLVPIGLALAPALVLGGLLLDRTLRTEARIIVSLRDPNPADRTTILLEALLVAFLAFIGVAALVPGGLPEPGVPEASVAPLSEINLLILAAADALVAGLLGYRASALRVRKVSDGLWAAGTYASAVAIGAAALRATSIPRLVGPAVLTLIFFLWDAFFGSPPQRRRDPRWIWQTMALLAVGVVVLAWNLGLRE
jgi:hypothetical protein